MKTIRIILSLVFVAGMLTGVNAQHIVKGTVSDISGTLEGAKVLVPETGQQAVTDAKGLFSIEVPSTDVRLMVSYKKLSQEVNVNKNGKELAVVLVPSERKLFKAVNNSKDVALCNLFLSHYPSSKKVEAVKLLKEQYYFINAYDIAAAKFSDTALRNYLKKYPDGLYAEKAYKGIEVAAWQNARHENTLEAYMDYLNKYPEGMAVKLAKEKLADLNK